MKDQLYAIVEPERIDMLTKLIEAYDNLGIVSTLDRSLGLVVIRATEDTFPDVEEILNNMPFPIHILPEDPRLTDRQEKTLSNIIV